MYSKIANPKTGRQVSIRSRLGKKILGNYLFFLNGGATKSSNPRRERQRRPRIIQQIAGLEDGGGYIPIGIGSKGRGSLTRFVLYRKGKVLRYNRECWTEDEDLSQKVENVLLDFIKYVRKTPWGEDSIASLNNASKYEYWKTDRAWNIFYPRVKSRLHPHITARSQNTYEGNKVGRLAGILKRMLKDAGIYNDTIVSVETSSAEFIILLNWWKNWSRLSDEDKEAKLSTIDSDDEESTASGGGGGDNDTDIDAELTQAIAMSLGTSSSAEPDIVTSPPTVTPTTLYHSQIQTLKSLGFQQPEEELLSLLEATGGNVDMVISLLFNED